MRTSTLVSIVGALCTGCGGGGGKPTIGSNGDGTVSAAGTLAGAPVSVTRAVAAIRPDQFASVDLTNGADACDMIVNGGGFPRGSTVIQLNVPLAANQKGLPAPGAYPIDTSGTLKVDANARFVLYRPSSCTAAASAFANASSGSITLDAISATEVSGSFDVTFGENSGGGVIFERVTGRFAALGCPLRQPDADPLKCSGFTTQ